MHQYLTKSNLDAYSVKFNKIFALTILKCEIIIN